MYAGPRVTSQAAWEKRNGVPSTIKEDSANCDSPCRNSPPSPAACGHKILGLERSPSTGSG